MIILFFILGGGLLSGRTEGHPRLVPESPQRSVGIFRFCFFFLSGGGTIGAGDHGAADEAEGSRIAERVGIQRGVDHLQSGHPLCQSHGLPLDSARSWSDSLNSIQLVN